MIGLLISPSLANPVNLDKTSSQDISLLSFPSGIGSVENGNLKITVNDENQAANGPSRFSLRTTGGDPSNINDDNQRLLFGYDSPWSSFSTVRIDGSDHIFGDSSCTFVENPTIGTDYISATCLYDTVQVTQNLTLVTNPQTRYEDIMEIRYMIKNTGQTSKSVGLRVQLDTMLAGNDGAPFQVPGTGSITTEMEFSGTSVPDYWLAFDNLATPTVLSQGTLRGGDATPPDRIVFAAWGSIYSTYWDYSILPGRPVTGDSAVGLYWNPEPLAPNGEVEYVTYYGLSSLSRDIRPPMSLSVSGPLYLDIVNNQYSPNPFTVTAFVQNTGTVIANDVATTITLPSELTLASGSPTQVFGTLNPGEIRSVSWQVMAADQATEVTLTYTISTIATGVSERTVTRSITLPALNPATPTLTSSLKITPQSPEYHVGDTLTAEFDITNIGNTQITLDKLLVGGRFNDGKLSNNEYPDFTSQSITLQPNIPYHYTGTLELTEAGNYHFFVSYYIANPTPEEKQLLDENNWNTAVNLGAGLTDADRIEDILVKNSLLLNIPTLYQNGESWSTDKLGYNKNPKFNLGNYGCAVTSTAMVLNYYGISTDPGKLNQWLIDHNGFDKQTLGDINWWAVPSISNINGVNLVTLNNNDIIKFMDDKKPQPADLDVINSYLKSYLKQGYPVIAKVYYLQFKDFHRIVIKGYNIDQNGVTYYINDPNNNIGKGGPATQIPDPRFNDNKKGVAGTIYKIVVYKGPIVL